MKAYKSLEAYNYVISEHVQVVLSHPISDDCPFMALKTKVTPSQRARDKPHQPWVYLDKRTGTVYCAHCTCMAGLGEVCSHVAALLFKVEIGVKMGLNQTSSTSKACQWNSTFRKEVTPTTITDIFEHIKGRRVKDVCSVQATGSAPMPPPEVIDDLYSLIPNAAFFTSVTTPSQIQEPQPVTKTDKFPKLLTTFQDNDTDPNDLDLKCKFLFETYSCSSYQSANLEVATRNQSVSPLWFQHRMGRVTASKAHDVLTRQATTPSANLVKRIVGYTSYDLSKKVAVKWGIDHEEECRQSYARHQTQQHLDFSCTQSGFHVSSENPFLGASPDVITNCQCCGRGIVKIKCPYKHKDNTIEHAAAIDSTFCLDKNLNLKTNHRYYTQIQFQMYILKVTYCDFVVYTKCKPLPSLVIIRVPIDINFCNSMIVKCNRFIQDYVVKELITRDLENQPATTSSTQDDNNNVTETWCLCSEPEYGRMIKCDNLDCPYQWFHYKCVNIRRKPRGKWYCLNCEK
ncbi:Hypothetical predicted protein [Mytilus galloprovincialis]|uniref:SWIM-type domain-containing protein n=2 Tax=Mytilus galloprovincialis TaxID=29158 RepID=A0A8B6DCP5_MYTGA|nr:Hypothetical predicted protein [Mytilus galloprovincialis]